MAAYMIEPSVVSSVFGVSFSLEDSFGLDCRDFFVNIRQNFYYRKRKLNEQLPIYLDAIGAGERRALRVCCLQQGIYRIIGHHFIQRNVKAARVAKHHEAALDCIRQTIALPPPAS